MKIKVAAALLLSPLMVHAQANSPAQPQAAQAPGLHASLTMPAGLMLSSASLPRRMCRRRRLERYAFQREWSARS